MPMDSTILDNAQEIKIAVVEDDRDLNDILTQNLIRNGYNTQQIFSGHEAVSQIIEQKPDAVLLDWVLPGTNGEEICKNLRNHGFHKSIIMLTGKKQDSNRISAYGFGVSSYIEKPFNMDILLAILKSQLNFSPPVAKQPEEVRFHDLLHYPQVNMVLKNKVRIELTVIENLILCYFENHPNTILLKRDIESHIWNTLGEGRSRSLDMHIMRLRKKIESNPQWPKMIITLKGKGIMFKNH
jgi:two-component system response regulator MtrA